MSAADGADALNVAEARSLFADLADHPVLILAVSGGPDSTALMWLAARWRKSLKRGPKLIAITVDHGLRAEARREAAAVQRLARSLGVAHRTLRWSGRKPSTGLQEAARLERYRLLGKAARAANAQHVLTAHTLDDQAETVLIRLTRGSGVSGLAAMARVAPLPATEGMVLVRPLLEVAKARLVATLRKAGIASADDPSNRDPRYTRVRMRAAMPALEREGLTAARRCALDRQPAAGARDDRPRQGASKAHGVWRRGQSGVEGFELAEFHRAFIADAHDGAPQETQRDLGRQSCKAPD